MHIFLNLKINEKYPLRDVKLQTCSKYARSGNWATSHLKTCLGLKRKMNQILFSTKLMNGISLLSKRMVIDRHFIRNSCKSANVKLFSLRLQQLTQFEVEKNLTYLEPFAKETLKLASSSNDSNSSWLNRLNSWNIELSVKLN